MTDIPTWAAQRACDLANAENAMGIYKPEIDVPGSCGITALARYIAEHEQEPVDMLRKEAIELVLADEVTRTDNQIAAIRSGIAGQAKVELALAGLRRGIEIRDRMA